MNDTILDTEMSEEEFTKKLKEYQDQHPEVTVTKQEEESE